MTTEVEKMHQFYRTIVEARDSSHKNDRRIKVLAKYLPEKCEIKCADLSGD
jgi:CRISPR/Cas system-associated protein endoribonuclease Cas2